MTELPDDELLTKYVLREELPDAVRDELEARYFSDEALFARLTGIEAKLIEDYLRANLFTRERIRLERVLARLPRWKRQVARLQQIKELLEAGATDSQRALDHDRSPETKRWGYHRLLLCTSMAAVLVAGVLGYQALNSHYEVQKLTRQNAEIHSKLAEARAHAEELQRLADQRPSSSPIIASLLLSPGAARDRGSMAMLVPRQGDRWVELKLQLENPERFQAIEVRVQRVGAQEVFRQRWITDGGRIQSPMNVLVPTQPLSPGHYLVGVAGELSLGGRQHLPSYSFQVSR